MVPREVVVEHHSKCPFLLDPHKECQCALISEIQADALDWCCADTSRDLIKHFHALANYHRDKYWEFLEHKARVEAGIEAGKWIAYTHAYQYIANTNTKGE